MKWFCPPGLYEGIEGDLLEQFENDRKEFGEKKARRRFAWHVVKFFRPGIFLRNRFSNQLINTVMWGNYFKVATRNIAKRKLYSFINAIGLSIGIAFSVLIYLYIQDEKNFDRFHVNKDRIYRLDKASYNTQAAQRGEYPVKRSAYVPLPLGNAVKDEIPEVQYLTRFNGGERGIFRYGEKVFSEGITLVDADFFRMFSFPLIAGSADRLFSDKYEVVLTPEIAQKYFGQEEPVGKVITLDLQGEKQFTVTGLIETPPANSSLIFKILVPIQSHPRYEHNLDQWGSFSFPTFIQLYPQATITDLKTKADTVIKKYMGEMLDRWHKEQNVPAGFSFFEPAYTNLADIHLKTEVGWDKVSDPKYAWILGGIALLIIVIASINYISLALTTSASRKIEVGIRKVVGAHRQQLVWQFGLESLMLAVISMFIGLGLAVFFLPAFNEFTGKGIALISLSMAQVAGASLGIALVVGLLAGSYPAVFLSGFLPVTVLKGGFTSKMKAGFTKPLVVFQFFLSASMIICSIIMYRQMEFIATKDLGFDKEHVLVIPTQTGWSEEADRVVEQFRNKMSAEPSVVDVAGTSSSFSRGHSIYGYKIKDENKRAYVYRVDPEYISLLSLTLKEGRNFDKRIASDGNAVIINESLARDMGWDNPLEEHLNWREDTVGLGSQVIGVLSDYHFLSLNNDIEPMFLSIDKKSTGYLTTMLVKLSPGDIPQKIEKVKSAWAELYPDKPFDYSFMDEDVAKQYNSYKRWMSITALSTGFAIFIACLGLFGLAGINAVNRTKEIGIRKVMGAELSHIFVLLNKQFVLLAVIAFLLAAPLSWYFMNKWLASFKYVITVGWELFAVSMLAGMSIALLTVSYHAIKAAWINPADTLKYE
ncbi:MAG: ABC transporter permease [Cyclobacteriaceae bacterium]|nr:ABC transporter permease [Cyclobacteriaceae bacterium]